jgi:hypothetical protein
MKLAEALLFQVDYQKKIQQLKERLIRTAKVQEGETPPEDPQALLAELDSTVNQLTNLTRKINKTNSATALNEDMTIADALTSRELILLKQSVYDSLVQTAATPLERYSRSEIRYLSTININDIQRKIERMSHDYRELDIQIQQASWQTELID